MTRAYKITNLPEGYCKLAIAAWKCLYDHDLYEIEGKLVFTEDLEDYLEGNDEKRSSSDVFDSHADFERWLLNCVAEWITKDPLTLGGIEEYIKLA